ncbi:diacylglycerol O-acyltransferase 1 [Trichonephila inaurata madagascariensis]|uniref:O-acyltransferase n=1 Tax=Trichonephila inaurata madagascariensis TaxID=2747483 RepID=A0A8X7C534_9ARAC|nr:diacylglycerol O-acyltransferase 1 [Trichonephila inaurata madagascariensis]
MDLKTASNNNNNNNNSNNHLRVRRTKSVSVAQVDGVSRKEYRLRSVQPDKPVHKFRDSLLSSASGYTNYRGFLNLCIILLVLSNARLVLENIIKYGILIDPIQMFKVLFLNPSQSPSILILIGLLFIPLVSLGIEKLLSKGKMSENLGLFCVITLVTAEVLSPPVVVYLTDCHAVAASIVMAYVSMVFLKLISYHMVNYWCRSNHTDPYRKRRRSFSTEREKQKDSSSIVHDALKTELVTYPNNLNLKDIYYFLFAPTLCYELNFPRSSRIRKRFLLKRLFEMFFLLQLILCLMQQWIVPTINNSLKPLEEMDVFRMVERLLKLAIPNHFIWLMFFYWYFHSSLNALAEILRFGDRHFYNDWWNAESVQYFWRNWNVPVHQWCVRHLYIPLRNFGCSKSQAATAVFLLSAFFHELPFSRFVEKYMHKQYGNMAVWISLIIGQPLCILMYYHDYYVLHLRRT